MDTEYSRYVRAKDFSERLMAHSYISECHGSDYKCFPAIGTIAKDLSYSARTVYRALDDLEAHGFIRREERWRDKGGRSSSQYVLVGR